jgi:putative ABC transport system permease protein
VANLYRPANQTVAVLISLGFGAFLLSTLFLVQHNLLRDFRVEDPGSRPNLMFFDVQRDQEAGVTEVIREAGVTSTPMVPIVPMRIKAIRGVPVRVDTTSGDSADAEAGARNARGRRRGRAPGPAGWALRREYRSTYRDTLTVTEKVVAGSWWPAPARSGPALISMEADLANELEVRVGDEIEWDVAGVAVKSRIANLREVDWGRFQTNFFVVFQSGALEQAPQMLVTLARVDSASARGALQRRMAERYPNVAAIDLSQVQQAIESILGKAALAVRFLALFSLAAGAVVLVGAVAASRFQRVREGVLLNTLGATRPQVLRIFFAEYLTLGLLAAVLAVALSSIAGWSLARWLFKASFGLPFLSLSGLTLTCIGLTVAVGLWSSAEILKRPPLDILREES